jgi:hypothetical protein
VHGAGRTLLRRPLGKPPTERRKNRDEEHLGAALVRATGRSGLELPDDAGPVRLLDYQVRAKIGRSTSRRPRESRASICSASGPAIGSR